MYDFTTRVSRCGQGSSKWEAMYAADATVPAGVVPLSVADMEFVNAPEIIDALVEHAKTTVLGYTGPTDEYYEAVLGWQLSRHGWSARREWVSLSPGVVPAVNAALLAFSAPGDGVIILTPVYHPFRRCIEALGRRVVESPLLLEGSRYLIDFEGLERAAADPRTTMLVLCSPHNPVGRVWTRDELARLARICCQNDVFICSDEIHNDLIMPGFEHTVLADVMPPEQLGNCMVCTAPSKTFNLAGLQCSNIFIPDPDRKKAFDQALSTHASFHSCNTFAYPAAIAAYTRCAGWLDELIEVVVDNYRLLVDFCAARLPQLRVLPLEGTYLAWVDCNGLGLPPDALATFMERDARLFLDAGTMFGSAGAGFERVNLAAPRAVIEEALLRLESAARAANLIA